MEVQVKNEILMWHHRPGYFLQSISRHILSKVESKHLPRRTGPFLNLVNMPDCNIVKICSSYSLFKDQQFYEWFRCEDFWRAEALEISSYLPSHPLRKD